VDANVISEWRFCAGTAKDKQGLSCPEEKMVLTILYEIGINGFWDFVHLSVF
jgi:hypothetical protein